MVVNGKFVTRVKLSNPINGRMIVSTYIVGWDSPINMEYSHEAAIKMYKVVSDAMDTGKTFILQ